VRNSPGAAVLRAALLIMSAGLASSALAHHPGSHVERTAAATVRLDASVLVETSCLTITEISAGAPKELTIPQDAAGVTIRLAKNGQAACEAGVRRLGSEAELKVPAEQRFLLLYIIGDQGTVIGSERVPILRP
jgi:hypothetical protein